jgi:hypothetical protein
MYLLQELSFCTAGIGVEINILALLICLLFTFCLLQPEALALPIWDLKLNTVIPFLSCEKSNPFYHTELFFGLKIHVFPYATTLKRITDNRGEPKLHVQYRNFSCWAQIR